MLGERSLVLDSGILRRRHELSFATLVIFPAGKVDEHTLLASCQPLSSLHDDMHGKPYARSHRNKYELAQEGERFRRCRCAGNTHREAIERAIRLQSEQGRDKDIELP